MNSVTAGGIIQKVFKQDLIQAVNTPKSKKSDAETLVKKGKIETIAHKEIMKGNLSDFHQKQEAMAISIDNVARRLVGEDEIPGGDKDATNKIYKEVLSQIPNSKDQKERLAQEMIDYSSSLRDVSMHRRAMLKQTAGTSDHEVFLHLDATNTQTNDKLGNQLKKELSPSDSLSQDISRNAIDNGRFKMQDSKGQDITPQSQNVYAYTHELLEISMVCLGMVDEKKEDSLSEKGMAIKDRFEQIVSESKATQIRKEKDDTFNNYSTFDADQLRAPMAAFFNELVTSKDPDQQKLAFALLSCHQSWVTIPGASLISLTKDLFGSEKCSEQIHAQTKFDLKFEADGGITLKTKGVHMNKDYEKTGKEEYTVVTNTQIKMNKNGSTDVKVDNSLELLHQVGKKNPAIEDFKDSLVLAGYEVKTKGVTTNSLLERNALVANSLIDAIRSKKPQNEEGIFRIPGLKERSVELKNNLVKQANLWDTEQVLLEEEDVGVEDIHNLASSFKYLLMGGFELIPSDSIDTFFEGRELKDLTPQEMLQFVMDGLPEENSSVLLNLCQLCHEIAANSDQNFMTLNNLVIALGPSISPSEKESYAKEAFGKLLEATAPAEKKEVVEDKTAGKDKEEVEEKKTTDEKEKL